MKLNKETLGLLYSLKQYHPHTFIHSINVASYSLALGEKLGLDQEDLDKLETAGLLHDIGKLKIPENILHKPGKFTDEEYEIMKKHPTYSVEILRDINFEDEELLRIIESHHERIDGRGYPTGISGNQIPFLAKIISVADSYDAMTSNRCYREKQDMSYVRDQFIKGAGQQFDMRLSMLLLSYLDEQYIHNINLESEKQKESILVTHDLEL